MRLAIVAATVLMTSPVLASSAGDLESACSSPPGTKGETVCNSFLNGFVAGLQMDQLLKEAGTPVCIEETSTIQVRKIVGDFFAAHPELRQLESGPVIGYALLQAYGCPK